jgi:uncharacterized protein (TIGR02145 family)
MWKKRNILMFIALLLASCSEEVDNWDAETVCPETLRSSFVDERDGQSYNTTTIGNQVWMAENLNYQTENSVCYNYEEANCEINGRLYPWSDAKDLACPEGWRLPTEDEWKELAAAMGGDDIAGKRLQAIAEEYEGSIGSDDCDFSAKGGVDASGELSSSSSFWSATQVTETLIIVHWFFVTSSEFKDYLGNSRDPKESIRCIKK